MCVFAVDELALIPFGFGAEFETFNKCFFCYLKISDDMSGARAAIRDTIPFPT